MNSLNAAHCGSCVQYVSFCSARAVNITRDPLYPARGRDVKRTRSLKDTGLRGSSPFVPSSPSPAQRVKLPQSAQSLAVHRRVAVVAARAAGRAPRQAASRGMHGPARVAHAR